MKLLVDSIASLFIGASRVARAFPFDWLEWTRLSAKWLSFHIENCIHLTAPRQREPVKIWAIRRHRSSLKAEKMKGRSVMGRVEQRWRGIRIPLGYSNLYWLPIVSHSLILATSPGD